MNYSVRLSSQNFNVKRTSGINFKVTREKTMPTNYFQELLDVTVPDISKVDPNPNKNQYVVAYDSTLNKFTLVDPDNVLIAAASTSSVQPGLPQQFINALDIDLDNRIDLDGGTW
jgi:hypothetical protein